MLTGRQNENGSRRAPLASHHLCWFFTAASVVNEFVHAVVVVLDPQQCMCIVMAVMYWMEQVESEIPQLQTRATGSVAAALVHGDWRWPLCLPPKKKPTTIRFGQLQPSRQQGARQAPPDPDVTKRCFVTRGLFGRAV